MLEVLLHATNCVNSLCQTGACRNMQIVLRHARDYTSVGVVDGTISRSPQFFPKGCQVKNCVHCRRLMELSVRHAHSCTTQNCNVIFCSDIKPTLQKYQETRKRAIELFSAGQKFDKLVADEWANIIVDLEKWKYTEE